MYVLISNTTALDLVVVEGVYANEQDAMKELANLWENTCDFAGVSHDSDDSFIAPNGKSAVIRYGENDYMFIEIQRPVKIAI